jgi:hypothetical protein
VDSIGIPPPAGGEKSNVFPDHRIHPRMMDLADIMPLHAVPIFPQYSFVWIINDVAEKDVRRD